MPALRLPLLLASVFALAAATPADAQVLYGRVTDAADGANVAAAQISALDAAGTTVASTVSGTDGRFELPLPAAGSFRVSVTRIGFRTGVSPVVAVGEGERIGMDLALRTDAVQMEAVQAEARVTPPFRDARARGFYDRMDAGMGEYMTREQIVARDAGQASDLLRSMPRVSFRGGIRSTGLWLGGAAAGCAPALYIDGFRRVLRPNERLDDVLDVRQIWGIEVYRYGSEIPSELPRDGRCGAVVIWTLNS
ncbi:MAG TPA: carboxypeptidase-like regulatory domain-containing protein [Longimicrobium sp.]|jgi:muconolactone delta-isomerase|nr:carboxypeptidase-like regulatory domain-containing protein [Longimicrobium sp.]